jgi:small subunit ribosomal protein S19
MAKRSVWKGPFIESAFVSSIKESKNIKKILNTTSRTSMILPFLIGKTVRVHNGKSFVPVKITEEMVGFKLGEFVATRVRHIYKKKK